MKLPPFAYRSLLFLLLLALLAGGCAPLPSGESAVDSDALVETAVAQALTATALFAPLTVTPTAAPSPTVSPEPTATAAPTLEPAVLPDPYADLTIASLAARSYGAGELVIERTMEETGVFTRYRVRFPSDGLAQYGFMNVPAGQGPFPVVILIHGYVSPEGYSILDYVTRYADELARSGYLVIHPNLRGYPPSEDGPNLHRVGFAVDVLNLTALVRKQGGLPGPLAAADPERIGLWGHSMGGGVATRAMLIDPEIKAVVLYGAMGADEKLNAEQIYHVFSNGTRCVEEMNTPPEALLEISPVYYLDRLNAAVSIHHGDADDQVPPAWSQDLCGRLQDLGKTVECFTYEGAPHTFRGEEDRLFTARVLDFFGRHLSVD